MRRTRILTALSVVCVLLLEAEIRAQTPPDPDYVLSLPHTGGPAGSVVPVTASLDSANEPVASLNLGICHDPGELTVEDVVAGGDLNTANGGQPPDFLVIESLVSGVTLAVVIDFFGVHTLQLGVQELLVVDYRLSGPPTTATLAFCDSLTPFASTGVITLEGDLITPVQVSGSITYGGTPPPMFTFTVPSLSVGFGAGIGEARFEVGATIGEIPSVPGQPTDTFGFSMGLSHDPSFLAVTGVRAASLLESLNGGGGAEFFAAELMPNGFTLGVVYSFGNPEILHYEVPQEVVRLSYDTNAATLQGITGPVTTVLDWTNNFGSPPVDNFVVVSVTGDVLSPQRVDGFVTLIPGGAEFVRGECSGNGNYDLGDPLGLLGSLFSGTGPVGCEDACDANDDGALSVADPLYMLENLFRLGPNPPGPYPVCGLDPSDDTLGCDQYLACP